MDSEISEIYRMALEDLGYDNVQIIFSDPKNSPQLLDEKGKPKSGTAFVDGKGVRTIIINAEDPKELNKVRTDRNPYRRRKPYHRKSGRQADSSRNRRERARKHRKSYK